MDDRLDQLDRSFGPVAVLSLTTRGLLPEPFGGGITVAVTEPVRGRVAGALTGAAIGSAMGLPFEWDPPGRVTAQEAVDRLLGGAVVAADVQLLGRSLAAMHEHGVSAAEPFAHELARLRHRLRNPGRAVPAAAERLRRGALWHEAGVASFGSGAAVRAVAAGIAFSAHPVQRPLAAALDTVVTHATRDAVIVSVAVAEVIAALLARPDDVEPSDAVGTVAAQLPVEIGELAIAGLRRGSGMPWAGSTAVEALTAAVAFADAHGWRIDEAVPAVVAAGGDTDTVAALTGALCGAAHGESATPAPWIRAVRHHDRLSRLAQRVAGAPSSHPSTPPGEHSDGLHISVLLDRSGSMRPLASDVVEGVNAFLDGHRDQAGRCRLTLAQFDSQDPFEVLLNDVEIGGAPNMTPAHYRPRGTTPLYDAIGSLLETAERRLARRHRAGVSDDDQLVVIFTDGLENASRRWDRTSVFTRIAALREAGWAFVFLGADQDAYAESDRIGIAAGNTSGWDRAHPEIAFESITRASVSYRGKTRRERFRDREDVFEGRKEAEERRAPSSRRGTP